jgi:hypothetical protein
LKDVITSQQRIAIVITSATTDLEKDALKAWLSDLLAIRAEEISFVTKSTKALKLTLQNKVLWPVVKLISREMKRYGWDERSPMMRRFSVVAAAGIATFGGQAAGIAALGTAIGVPLWVIFGAGAAFVPVLLREFSVTELGGLRQKKDEVATGLDIDVGKK